MRNSLKFAIPSTEDDNINICDISSGSDNEEKENCHVIDDGGSQEELQQLNMCLDSGSSSDDENAHKSKQFIPKIDPPSESPLTMHAPIQASEIETAIDDNDLSQHEHQLDFVLNSSSESENEHVNNPEAVDHQTRIIESELMQAACLDDAQERPIHDLELPPRKALRCEVNFVKLYFFV